jgi:hypothetical protein
MRWSDYFLRRGTESKDFWKEYLAQRRDVLFIVGMGFDPRTCQGYSDLLAAGGSGRRDCTVMLFDEGPESPSIRYSELFKNNQDKLASLIPRNAQRNNKSVVMRASDGRRVGSRNSANSFGTISELSPYTDVIIDVSSMPRGIYFPLIGKILFLVDSTARSAPKPNVHVVVSENADLDGRIRDEGIAEEANYMPLFTGTLQIEGLQDLPKVWIPILGEHQEQQLERVYNLVTPDEISPILPAPSSNPRRGDDLLFEYRELLFDRLRVEPKDFVYVDEQNPFQVYQAIHRTVSHYNQALQSLGGCQVVLSAFSSKLLSIGALLSAYELKTKGVGVANVETLGYGLELPSDTKEVLDKTEPCTMWIAGECYENHGSI